MMCPLTDEPKPTVYRHLQETWGARGGGRHSGLPEFQGIQVDQVGQVHLS